MWVSRGFRNACVAPANDRPWMAGPGLSLGSGVPTGMSAPEWIFMPDKHAF
ncbi:hypothetical protein SZ55_1581 [Pseudomonas sp. FeS53a]|nr:hypothetical protein SZ55_1581 [Pseudomonas sp. FeS53a]